MRDFLNAILSFIESESLTDEEFEGVTLQDPPSYSRATYLSLRVILEARENVSDKVKRLKLYFIAKGVDISSTPKVPTPNSNIFIGGPI